MFSLSGKGDVKTNSDHHQDACVRAQSLHLCLTLCDPMGCNLPGSSVHGILQARILEWVAMPSSRGSSQPRDRTHVSCIGRWVLHPLSHLGSPAPSHSSANTLLSWGTGQKTSLSACILEEHERGKRLPSSDPESSNCGFRPGL